MRLLSKILMRITDLLTLAVNNSSINKVILSDREIRSVSLEEMASNFPSKSFRLHSARH